MRRRVSGVALAAVGLAMVVASIGSASGQEATLAFGAVDLAARGEGVDVVYTNLESGQGGQGSSPETVATMNTGPVGTALASLAWPGPLVADIGTLITFLGGPEDAKRLNYPVRAQAYAPQGPADAKTEAGPGTSMSAHADLARSEAIASSSGSENPGSFSTGNMRSTARTVVADKALAEATSEVNDFNLGNGTVTIESVRSFARATSDGVDATSDGRTTFSGVKVAGRPATIDENGIRFDQNGSDAIGAAANQIGNQALQQAGIKVYVTKPVQTKSGSTATMTAGSVVFVFSQPGHVFTIALGGATARANAVPGDPSFLADLGLELDEDGTFEPPVLEGSLPGAASSGDTDDVALPAATPGSPTALPPGTAALASSPRTFYGGLPWAAAVGALVGAGFIAFGLRRLADDVLSAPASVCNLERNV